MFSQGKWIILGVKSLRRQKKGRVRAQVEVQSFRGGVRLSPERWGGILH